MTLLLGGGGHARDILAIFRVLDRDRGGAAPVVVVDDGDVDESLFFGAASLFRGGIREALAQNGAGFISAVGFPDGRRTLVELAAEFDAQAAEALVHPSACVDATVQLSGGCVIFGQTWVSPLVNFGPHVHVGYGATVGHDTVLGQFSAVMPGASIGGEVEVGEGCMVGANATVLQGLTVGAGSSIGAGAVVTRNVSAGSTVVGSPARKMEVT